MEDNPYASPQSESPESRTPGLLGHFSELFEIRNWRLGVLGCFIIAALVTPADPYSIFFAAVPLSAIYLLIVGLKAWFMR